MANMRRVLAMVLALTLFAALPVAAQDDAAPTPAPITQDEVNAIASGMYCPVCENEPLDTCRANTCVMWRGEIRDMLEQGMSEDQIVADFVDRFGQRVVDVPEDEGLRALTFVGPVIMTLLAFGIGGFTFLRWQANNTAAPVSEPVHDEGHDDYRSRLESDLQD